MTRQPASPTSRVLFLLSKKLIETQKASRKNGRKPPRQTPLRESMIDLHRCWYETEESWQAFLSAVRNRKNSLIHDKLLDAAATMLRLAATMYQGPLTYEAAVEPENLQDLLKESECQNCGHQGDLISILPHPKTPQWKLECLECGSTWVTGQGSGIV